MDFFNPAQNLIQNADLSMQPLLEGDHGGNFGWRRQGLCEAPQNHSWKEQRVSKAHSYPGWQRGTPRPLLLSTTLGPRMGKSQPEGAGRFWVEAEGSPAVKGNAQGTCVEMGRVEVPVLTRSGSKRKMKMLSISPLSMYRGESHSGEGTGMSAHSLWGHAVWGVILVTQEQQQRGVCM